MRDVDVGFRQHSADVHTAETAANHTTLGRVCVVGLPSITTPPFVAQRDLLCPGNFGYVAGRAKLRNRPRNVGVARDYFNRSLTAPRYA